VADNAALIRDLYAAMNRHDGDAMAELYAPDGRFEDPAFGVLSGAEAGDMWRMLISRAEDLRVELPHHRADGDTGEARWIATYTFRTGRPVVNEIQARFRFRDGRIVDHRDSFSFWRWSRQALGPVGLTLGWTPLLRAAVRRRARADLQEYRRGS
jgi:ketosteroid isomerase-like protein